MLDRLDPQMAAAPRVAREGRADRLLGGGLDRVHDADLVDRAAQHDQPLVDEPVHEGRVLPPARLVFERQRGVPFGARAPDGHEEHRHRTNVAARVDG